MDNPRFEIKEHIAELSRGGRCSLELNTISYDRLPARLDLRRWEDGRPGKGTTLSDTEARRLIKALSAHFEGEAVNNEKESDGSQ